MTDLNIDKERGNVIAYFSDKKWEEGRKLLFKLYNTKLQKINNIEDIRFIVYNLAWVECRLGNVEASRRYILEIKNTFESDDNYIKYYSTEYCKILDQYNFVNEDILSVEDKIKLYEKTYDIYYKINSNNRYMSLHNIYYLKKEYFKIPKLIKEMLDDIGLNQCFVEDMIEDLKTNDEESYNIACKIIQDFKLSNTSII